MLFEERSQNFLDTNKYDTLTDILKDIHSVITGSNDFKKLALQKFYSTKAYFLEINTEANWEVATYNET